MEQELLKCRSSEPILSRHINELGVKMGLPVSGTFELTSRCNFSCPMCYIHSDEKQFDELDAEQWIELARQAKEAGLMFLLLTGGEPFVRKDFEKIYTEIINMGIVVSINTNASLYNDDLRALFRKYPPSRINVSVYAGSREGYLNMCRNEAFDRVYENLSKMKEDSLNVRANVSLTPYNYSEMEKINAVLTELNLQSKATSYMYPPVRLDDEKGKNAGRFSAEKAGECLAHWHKIHEAPSSFLQRAEMMRNPVSPEIDTSVGCRAGRCSFWITCDGRMLPCGTMDIEASYPLDDGFENAWQQVKSRVSAIRLPEKCVSCPLRSWCGVCASICKDETGDFSQAPDYVCTMTETLRSEILRLSGKGDIK